MSSKEWPCCFHGHSIIPTWNILKILCLWSENRTQVNSSWVTEPLTVWIINIHNHATWAFKYVIRLAFCIVICLSLTSQIVLYWMTLLLPWPSRRMASHGSSSRVESWDISSGETTATSRRPPAGEKRGGRRGKLGILTQVDTFAKKMHLLDSCLKISPCWS